MRRIAFRSFVHLVLLSACAANGESPAVSQSPRAEASHRLPLSTACAGITSTPAPGPFVLAQQGCPMAHCDPAMSDLVRMPVPPSVASSWSDPVATGSSIGIGCSGNGTVAACTFGNIVMPGAKPYLKAYDAEGNVLWDDGNLLDVTAWTSAPMVDDEGGVIAADDQRLVRFAPDGTVQWCTPTAGGTPISPTLIPGGTVVLATSGGPVSAYDSVTGALLDSLNLTASVPDLVTAALVPGRFETANTPGARGSRIYVSTEFVPDDPMVNPGPYARLYAIDVQPELPVGQRLRVAWYYQFGARSGASPLVIDDLIIFDGDRESPDGPFDPHFFAVRDQGATSSLAWKYRLNGIGMASAARDPRGGAWVFAAGGTTAVRLSEECGSVVQTLDFDAIVGAFGFHRPSSVLSIAEGPAGQPVMIASASAVPSVYVAAIDLVQGSALWTYQLSNNLVASFAAGQWPILTGADGRQVVVFTTARNGIHALAGPPAP